MGSTLFVLDWVAAPLRRGWARIGQARTQARLQRIRELASAGNRIQALDGGRAQAASRPSAPAKTQPRRVRVLRIVDAGGPASAAAGRLVLSGRLADVCAELDRLVALEAAAA